MVMYPLGIDEEQLGIILGQHFESVGVIVDGHHQFGVRDVDLRAELSQLELSGIGLVDDLEGLDLLNGT